MKIKNYRLKIAALFAFAIALAGFNFGVSTIAQETQRDRLAAKPTPTPGIPDPKTLKEQVERIKGLTPTPTPPQVQTLDDLQTRIRTALLRPELQRGQVGLKVVSLDSNKTIYEQNAEKYFMPASNMKSFTVAAALERLSPDFRFVTSVFASQKPDAGGTVKGLTIYGRGDVSFSTAFNDGDYYKGLDALAEKIVQAGVKRIEGDLVGDESYFTGYPIAVTWEWDDLQWNDAAEISALPVNDNAVDLSVKPGAFGRPCLVQVLPANAMMKIVNTCVTSAAGTKDESKVSRELDQNIIEVSGSMPADHKGYTRYVAVSHPAELFVTLLRQVLEKRGVVITGQNRVIGTKEKAYLAVASSLPPVEIVRFESPPLALIAAKTMKPSQNTYTETILWMLGEQIGNKSDPKLTSAERGIAVVQTFLRQVGISADSIVQWDASGLSRHNLVTPASLVQLYTYMAMQSRYSEAWRNSLTIGGIDGTLRNRFKGTIAAGNVRGKTGTIGQVSALSGYVTTASGGKLVFSIIVNGVPDSRIRQATIDEIVIALAGFDGRTN
jgi:D-alanyl-D-alanine carboxypeptidase/D-alanyl-D-alanine-endopeptidase (penicillin-binding protein 4)